MRSPASNHDIGAGTGTLPWGRGDASQPRASHTKVHEIMKCTAFRLRPCETMVCFTAVVYHDALLLTTTEPAGGRRARWSARIAGCGTAVSIYDLVFSCHMHMYVRSHMYYQPRLRSFPRFNTDPTTDFTAVPQSSRRRRLFRWSIIVLHHHCVQLTLEFFYIVHRLYCSCLVHLCRCLGCRCPQAHTSRLPNLKSTSSPAVKRSCGRLMTSSNATLKCT